MLQVNNMRTQKYNYVVTYLYAWCVNKWFVEVLNSRSCFLFTGKSNEGKLSEFPIFGIFKGAVGYLAFCIKNAS